MKYLSFIIILWITLALSTLCLTEKSVQAVSEGSDCRCKCILTIKDGGLCEGSPIGGPHKSIYLVETISGGKDCRCSCNTPPPGGCDKTNEDFMPGTSRESRERERRKPLLDIDLIELHGSISDMVTAMVKLEKAVAKKTSKNNLALLKNNVQKVVSDLKSTNGSYSNLLDNLNLVDEVEKEENKDSEASTPSQVSTESTTTQKTVNTQAMTTTSVELIDVKLVTTPKSTVVANKEEALTTTTSPVLPFSKIQKHIVASKVHPTISETVTSSKSSNDDDVVSSTTLATTMSDNTTPVAENLPKTTRQSEDIKNSSQTDPNFDIATSTAARMTTVGVQNVQTPVKPKLMFVPYRDTSKDKSKNVAKTSPSKSKEEHVEYEYDYDDFDVSLKNKASMNRQKSADSTTVSTTTTKKTTTTTLQSTGTTTTESYYDSYFAEYDNDDDDDYEYDDVTVKTTTTTTTAATTPPDRCGTLLNLSLPVEISHFGRREGAWMRDPIPSKKDPMRTERIYIANFYYGTNLIEFDSVEGVKKLQYQNSYSLPHTWMGTGHIVYNGSFYYNRAFSRTLIKYNLQERFVKAWVTLTNMVYYRRTPFTWRGHSMLHMAADEDGLWVIYPAKDPFDYNAKLTYVINKINPVDLRIIESYKSNIRQTVSHVFMMCGVLYSTDLYNKQNARVTHAFDTRTLVQRSFHLGFENLFSYNVQFLYNPRERKIYSWDNGRQVEYSVNMMY